MLYMHEAQGLIPGGPKVYFVRLIVHITKVKPFIVLIRNAFSGITRIDFNSVMKV